MIETEFEKLGVFYLGQKFDIATKGATNEIVLYDSKDLTTHAVCIGMTGSGKTGLCLGMLEEAAIDGIPVIAIDVKGDLSNLLLNFPQVSAEDLQPWLDPHQASQNGVDLVQYAQQRATRHLEELAASHQSAARIKKLQDAAEVRLYTPGSAAGISVSVLKSFDAPPQAVLEDPDSMRERIGSAVTSILILLGIEADPLTSKEHILLSNIFKTKWQQNESIDPVELVHLIQKPPLTRIGAIDIESIFPAKERFELSMRLNNVIASPGFESWLRGEPLEIDTVLYSPSGKPRTSVFYIAHLNDTERMFFVTLLLSRVISWMRAQSGTSSLRAILFMDEIFGYFPPVANPPSKQPLLTLLKQARAFGLGVMLATQNPVDIDYKGLSNAGTWFIGRLQTERDKARLLDGLEGATAAGGGQFDRAEMDKLLSGLSSRIFLMNNVHDQAPTLFKTRATLSFLAGPLTLEQLRKLKRRQTVQPHQTPDQEIAAQKLGAKKAAQPERSSRPIIPPDVRVCYLPVRSERPTDAELVYVPRVIAFANVHFTDTKTGVDTRLQYGALGTVSGDLGQLDWTSSESAKVWIEDLLTDPAQPGNFEHPPSAMTIAKSYQTWQKEFITWIAAAKSVRLWKSDATGEYSKARENERDFRIRIAQTIREKRDEAVAQLKAKWAPKLATLQDKIHRAQQSLEREQAEARQQQFDTAVNLGATVLGALVGNRRNVGTISRASSAARSVGRNAKQQQDVDRAGESLQRLEEQAAELNSTFAAEISSLENKFDPHNTKLTELIITAKKANISVPLLAFAWAPYYRLQTGQITPAWIREKAK